MGLFREASTSIADQMDGSLRPKRVSSSVREVSPAAYENYMRGRVHQQSFNPADLDRAQQYFEAALQIQPDYAPAYAGMSLVWGSRQVLGLVPANYSGDKWTGAAQRAVELDPELAEGHQALAQGHTWYEFDWEKAEAAYERAIGLDPNEPQARIFYAHFLGMLQRADESDFQIKKALDIDPHNPFTRMMYGIQQGMTRRLDEGIATLTVVHPNPLRSFALSWHLFGIGDYQAGAGHFADYLEMLGDSELAAMLRDAGEGVQPALVRVGEALSERASTTFVKPNRMWHAFGWGGDVDRAIEWLERGYEMRDHEVTYQASIPVNPELAADERFTAFLARLNLPLNPS